MKLTLKNSEIVALLQGISIAIGSLKGVSPVVGLRLAYNAKQLSVHAELYENARKDLLTQFAKKNDDGSVVEEEIETPNGKVKNVVLADRPAFEAAFNDVLKEEYDVDLKEIEVNMLPSAVDPAIIFGIYSLITDGAPAPVVKLERPQPVRG